MYLKEIEIQGFKSFADKTKVVFDRGVTAVVGPNGSGKSNITESLRWALGESSVKSLRGGKMPDVIFAGTETRKALNYASVTVLLDNSDGFIKNAGQEIRVERQIYRTGESEYKIDGRKVRLRDIHDLFLDTGLGRDSFSIISQGRVEEIFNSKPDERRAIFEEAAGVLKYKTRRKETESKLAQTQDNLDRLEDIIFELDTQVKPLEKQAQTAQRFLDLDGQRKELYLDVLVAKILQHKEELDQAQTNLSQIQEELQAYYQKRDQLEADNAQVKKDRQKLLARQEEDQQKILHLTTLISDLERKLDRQLLEDSQAETSRLERQERLEILASKEQDLQGQILGKRDRLAQLGQDLQTNQAQVADLEKKLAAFSENPDQLIENLRDQYVQLVQEEAEVSNHVTSLQGKIESQTQQLESQKSEFAKLQEDLQQAKRQEIQAQEELDVLTDKVKQLLASYQQEQGQVAKIEEDYRSQQGAMFDLMDALKSRKARAESLENILKNHSNFYAGVRAVLQQSQALGGILGAVSEHLSFDTRYQTALEIALGGSSQHIIVEDEQAATRAIDFLKKERTGRATFLPLTTIKSRSLADHHRASIEAIPGFLGMASQLVTFDQRLGNIFENLLGSTAIFESTEQARAAARAVRYQVRIVTLDGTELRPGGSYAGGTNRNQNTTFIKPELDQLRAEMEQVQAQLTSKEKEVEQVGQDLEIARQRLDGIRQQGEEARLAEQKAVLAHEQAAKHLADLQELYHLQAGDLQGQEVEVWTAQQTEHQARLTKISEEKMALEEQIQQIRSSKDEVESHINQLQEQLASATLKQTELKSHQQFELADLQRLEQEGATVQADMISLQELLEEKKPANPVDLEQLRAQLSQAQAEKEDLSQSLIRLKFELEDLEGQLEDIESHLETARHQNEDLIRQQAQAEAQRDRLADILRRLQASLSEDYRMSFKEAKEQTQAVDNLAQAEQAVKDLEKAIRALGPVNLDAIAQFDEVKSRLGFLNGQRDDILSAKNLLLETITEMNDEVKERFKSTFETIRESFKVTFRQMFGGGQADLILTDGDLLTAGVEISVQPPGKKIQSLNLMSGGEKALSALALLFSIIRVKTIPFVILDEVEAALDEANVKRFGDYLNRFDKDSQFIVVTHRKGTMAAADSIYGVTMQESGVSKIVSVKLTDIESM